MDGRTDWLEGMGYLMPRVLPGGVDYAAVMPLCAHAWIIRGGLDDRLGYDDGW